MENYNRIHQGVVEGVSELSYLEGRSHLESSSEEDMYINSILKSKLRSIVMIAHLDKCMKLLKEEQIRKNAPEKFEAFKLYYLDNVTQEEIAEILHSTDRTVRRWVSEVTEILSVYLFGADAIVLE
jgi:DNA-directed RNA polymerase specialized sigma24 family protein